jgi:hypothetical protein
MKEKFKNNYSEDDVTKELGNYYRKTEDDDEYCLYYYVNGYHQGRNYIC